MSTVTGQTTTSKDAESQIRALQDDWLKLAATKDVNRIMSIYTSDVVAYDAIGQLRFRGKEAYCKHWEACLVMCPGPMEFEIQDLDVAVDGDVAFSHHLIKHEGKNPETGEDHTCWMRVTSGYRKRNGKWLIAHEHISSPIDMESGKAMFDATP
jgi:PhnB protein